MENILDPPSTDKTILWKEMKGEGIFGRGKRESVFWMRGIIINFVGKSRERGPQPGALLQTREVVKNFLNH